MANLIVGDVASQLIEALQPIVERIKRRNRSLSDQLVRAATSIALNIGEADYSDPGNKRARLFTAAGSASETRLALRAAVAWKYCAPSEAEAARQLLDRVVAMLWKLTH